MTLLQCRAALVDQTLGALRKAGRQRVERVVFWLGHREPTGDAIIDETHIPQQQAAEDYFRIPPEAMIAFMGHLRRRRLALLAQVHSHPGAAFHSAADDQWAVVRHQGGLSIVVPAFAADVTAANFEAEAAVFRLTREDHWLRVTFRRSPKLVAHHMTTITPAQENELTLARLIGVRENQAAERLNRRVTITHGGASAALFAQELREQLVPTVNVTVGGTCDLEVVIDAAPLAPAVKRLFVALQQDSVSISKSPGPPGARATPLHGLQTTIAACFAAGVVLRRVIDGMPGSDADPFIVRFDAVGATQPVLGRPISLDDTVLVGAGAVANGFLRAARHLDIRGVLTVADPKRVGSGNPNRCLYFDDGDVGRPKASRVCEKAQPDFPRLGLEAAEMTFAELVKIRGRVRRAIVAADSRRARRSIQKELPLEVLDASTTDVSEIIVHSHRQPTEGACLACIYRHIPDELARERDIASGLGIDLTDVTAETLIDERVAGKITANHPQLSSVDLIGKAFDSLFKQLCGEQALLTPTGAQVLAPFAFVSNLAGALLALELSRFDAGRLVSDNSNYLCLSPWAPPHSRVRRWRGREPGCEYCGSPQTQGVLRDLWPEYDLWTRQH